MKNWRRALRFNFRCTWNQMQSLWTQYAIVCVLLSALCPISDEVFVSNFSKSNFFCSLNINSQMVCDASSRFIDLRTPLNDFSLQSESLLLWHLNSNEDCCLIFAKTKRGIKHWTSECSMHTMQPQVAGLKLFVNSFGFWGRRILVYT